MGVLGRILGTQPPKIPAGASVRLESVPVAGIGVGSLEQRPYWVLLDDNRQEVGDRHYLRRQGFTDLDYGGRWCQWVQAQGALAAPDVPNGGI